MDDQCQNCDAKCCKYFCFEIDKPDTFEEFEDIRWFLCHEGVSIHIDEGDWYISIDNPCKMLDENNKCTIYDTRPMICRNYSMDNCDNASGDYEYDELFETPQDIEAYARKTLGEQVYERARAKMLASAKRKVSNRNGTKSGKAASR